MHLTFRFWGLPPMTFPSWTENLSRAVLDSIDGVALCTRDDARRYIDTISPQRLMTMQWHIARNLLMAGADAEPVTRAIELALKFEGRLGAPPLQSSQS